MKIAIINSVGFWDMGWATDPASQQDVIRSLERANVEVLVFEVASKAQLDNVLGTLKTTPCLVWPNAYQVNKTQGSSEAVWLGDVLDAHGMDTIGNNATALKNVLLKSHCQQLLESQNVAIPGFAVIDEAMLNDLSYILDVRQLTFPLFIKPNNLSTSKGITQDNVIHSVAALRQRVQSLGDEHGYPVMVEEYLPGQDITVSVFMTPEKPVILATYYDTKIYDDPGAVLDYDVRQRDWNDGKWLRVVTDPELLQQIASVVIPACKAVGITEFTRIDCRLDTKGLLKAFDVNGLPGLELPFSTTVWQMIVKMQAEAHTHLQEHAFDTLISMIVYCAAHRNKYKVPARINTLAQAYMREELADEGTEDEPLPL